MLMFSGSKYLSWLGLLGVQFLAADGGGLGAAILRGAVKAEPSPSALCIPL